MYTGLYEIGVFHGGVRTFSPGNPPYSFTKNAVSLIFLYNHCNTQYVAQTDLYEMLANNPNRLISDLSRSYMTYVEII